VPLRHRERCKIQPEIKPKRETRNVAFTIAGTSRLITPSRVPAWCPGAAPPRGKPPGPPDRAGWLWEQGTVLLRRLNLFRFSFLRFLRQQPPLAPPPGPWLASAARSPAVPRARPGTQPLRSQQRSRHLRSPFLLPNNPKERPSSNFLELHSPCNELFPLQRGKRGGSFTQRRLCSFHRLQILPRVPLTASPRRKAHAAAPARGRGDSVPRRAPGGWRS